jgi:hypothetical protein
VSRTQTADPKEQTVVAELEVTAADRAEQVFTFSKAWARSLELAPSSGRFVRWARATEVR